MVIIFLVNENRIKALSRFVNLGKNNGELKAGGAIVKILQPDTNCSVVRHILPEKMPVVLVVTQMTERLGYKPKPVDLMSVASRISPPILCISRENRNV